ncbi:hypothetical protein LSAT2_029937, partial [Lamellibrachia satsuma]
MLTFSSCHETLESVVCVVAASIATLYNVVHKEGPARPESKIMLDAVESTFNTLTECIVCWLRQTLPMRMLTVYNQFVDSNELLVWSRLIGIEFGSDQYTERWRQHILLELDFRIKQ